MDGPPTFRRVMIRATRIAATIPRPFSLNAVREPGMSTPDRHDVRGGVVELGAVATLFFIVPGYPHVAAIGLPLGPVGTMAVAAVVVIAVTFRNAPMRRTTAIAAGTAMAVLLAARMVTGAATERHGWIARYFANDSWSGTPEWSSDFRTLGATRIDDRIAFEDDALPAHYLNDAAFDRGMRREVSEPMSVDWRAHTFIAADRTLPISLRARGSATVAVDDRIVLIVSSHADANETTTSVRLGAGVHTFTVRYVKPADNDPLIAVGLPIPVTVAATAR